jgi:hypothetical protein
MVKWKNGRAAWGYSGNYDMAKIVWEKINENFALSETITRDQIKIVLSKALAECMKKKEQFFLLFSAWTEGEEKVLLFSGGTDVMYGDRCEIIGTGDSPLSRFLRDIYLRAIQVPTVWQSALAAIYIVGQEKKYNGQFIGGGTDIILIESPVQPAHIMFPEHCQEWEKQLSLLESRNVNLLSAFTDPECGEEILEERKKHFESMLSWFSGEARK